jgi:sugar lactone lactonase YvrE
MNSTSPVVVVAGTGVSGSAANQLNSPNGIVVDLNFTLYVADYENNRVQRFWYGELNGTTVVGSGATGNIILNGPTVLV